MSQLVNESLTRYKAYLSADDFAKLQSVTSQAAPLSVRINLLKNPKPLESLNDWRSRYGWQTKPVPFWNAACQILQSETLASQTVEHRFGYYYIQDAASILPVALFDPIQADHLILDMAASPGGKTTHLMDRSLDKAFILANDSSTSRLNALRVVSQTWGLANYAICNYPGEKIGDWYPNTFDRVLLDAPCSMESLRVSESHPFRVISSSERERLAIRQLTLLVSAIKACKIGGEVVYSTCTMAPEEDESVINNFINLFPNCIEIAQTEFQTSKNQGLILFENTQYDSNLSKSLRVWPHLYETNGFFAVKLIKTNKLPCNELNRPQRSFKQTGYVQLKEKEQTNILKQISDRFSLSPSHLERFEIYQRDNNLQLIPKAYLEKFHDLPYYNLGLNLGKLIKSSLEVSLDFVNRFGGFFNNHVWDIPEDIENFWHQGHDLREISLPPEFNPGVIAIKNTNNSIIGAGKWSAQRLRNLLPHRYLL